MKRLAIAALVLLSGCDGHRGPPMDPDSIYERAQPVRSCPNGTLIGQDPVSRRYVYDRPWFGHGLIAPGVTPEEFCK